MRPEDVPAAMVEAAASALRMPLMHATIGSSARTDVDELADALARLALAAALSVRAEEVAGLPFVVSDAVPDGTILAIPPREADESEQDWHRRVAAITNVHVNNACTLRWAGPGTVHRYGHRCVNPPDMPHQCACGATT